MPELDTVKQQILDRSIETDQHATASMWLNTFLHSDPNDAGVNMFKLLLACLKEGDFQVRLVGATEFTPPDYALTVTDYISHASRVILDYSALSPAHQNDFLTFFPKPNEKEVFARVSTHAVVRTEKGIKELKGVRLGLQGQLPAFINPLKDFGVNIAMGGVGKSNLLAQTIAKNGYSGHVFFHHNVKDALLMIGLEQSATAKSILSILDLFSLAEHAADETQSHTDQFGQGHSLIGASDTYTAAGSLYFSDPIYQAKLLAEHHALSPQKYGGMQITLNDENWLLIKQFIAELNENCTPFLIENGFQQLLSRPRTAIRHDTENLPYIALNFQDYLHQCITVFIPEGNIDLQAAQNALLARIKKMQLCESELDYLALNTLFTQEIAALIETARALPNEQIEQYIRAIQRIGTLFELQLKSSHTLTRAQQSLLTTEQLEKAEIMIEMLLNNLLIIRSHLNDIHTETVSEAYLAELSGLIDCLRTCKKSPQDDEYPDFAWIEEEKAQLNRYQDLIQGAKLFLEREKNTLQSERQKAYEKVREQETAQNKLLSEINALRAAQARVVCEKNDFDEQLKAAQKQIGRLDINYMALEKDHVALQNQLALAAEQLITQAQLLEQLQQTRHLLAANNAALQAQLQEATRSAVTNQFELPTAACRSNATQSETKLPPLFDGLTLQVLGAFSFAVGAAAVSLAITSLIMCSAGLAIPLTMTASGLVTCFAGSLFFYQGAQQSTNSPPQAAKENEYCC